MSVHIENVKVSSEKPLWFISELARLLNSKVIYNNQLYFYIIIESAYHLKCNLSIKNIQYPRMDLKDI